MKKTMISNRDTKCAVIEGVAILAECEKAHADAVIALDCISKRYDAARKNLADATSGYMDDLAFHRSDVDRVRREERFRAEMLAKRKTCAEWWARFNELQRKQQKVEFFDVPPKPDEVVVPDEPKMDEAAEVQFNKRTDELLDFASGVSALARDLVKAEDALKVAERDLDDARRLSSGVFSSYQNAVARKAREEAAEKAARKARREAAMREAREDMKAAQERLNALKREGGE